KINAQNMYKRFTRELVFDQVYLKAYKQLYPTERAIMTQGQSGDTLQSGDRVWLFVKMNTPLGSFAYQHLLKVVQATQNTVLDIYFIGKNVTKANIQQWAMNMDVPEKLVN